MGEVFHHVSIFVPRRPGGLWTAISGPLAKSLVRTAFRQPSDAGGRFFPQKCVIRSRHRRSDVVYRERHFPILLIFVETIQSQMHDSATHVHTLIPTLAKTIITLDAVSP